MSVGFKTELQRRRPSRAGLDGGQHRQERHQRLAAADVALQQADHALGLGHVGGDLGRREGLARRQLEGQGRERALLQAPVAPGRTAGKTAIVMTHHRDGELAREQLVDEALVGIGPGIDIGVARK